MKRSELELRKAFKRKVMAIEKYLEMVSHEDPLSELRQEIAIQIAVSLRALFCHSSCEPLITMAKEVVFAFKYLNKPPIMWPHKSEQGFMLRVFDYSDGKNKRYKYSVCKDDPNLYDTNRKWPCRISSHPISSYDLLFRIATFLVYIIRIEEYKLN